MARLVSRLPSAWTRVAVAVAKLDSACATSVRVTSPTLLIGALYGGAFGYGVHSFAPALVPQPELFVLLGMVVMFGSIVKGYWSGLLMVADLSGCYHQLLLPGVIAGGISYFASWEILDRSIFGLSIDPSSSPGPKPAVAATGRA